jgi:cobalt-zinc-cadmium efflux system protein
VVTATFFVIEVIGGLLSGSLALLADAAHMFTDVGAGILAYAAMNLAEREATKKYTFGLYRAEILAAFVNAQILLLIAAYIFYEAYQRLHEPPEIHTGIMLWVAAAGLVANLVSMRLLHGQHTESLNVKAAYLEVVTDALGSIGVLVAAGLIRFTGWYWLDPLVSAGIGCLVLPRTVALLRESAHILLEGTPGNVDVENLRLQILEIQGVEELHDLHCWTLTSGFHSVSVHVRAAAHSQRGDVLRAVQDLLKHQAGIDHATIQVERGSEVACEMFRTHP